MRILFTVQRFGAEIGGGAELHCREFARRLASRGHDVDVLTSCAVNYSDWANDLREGVEDDEMVTVHRLPVVHPRRHEVFAPLNARVVGGGRAPLYLEESWMVEQGPQLRGLERWFEDRAGDYDVAVFFTYLYYTTWAGLRATAGRVPTVLHATAHDEPAFHLPIFDLMLHRPTAYAFSTPEEEGLVRSRGVTRPGEIIGVGTAIRPPADARRFRTRFGIDDRPYVMYLGRLDPGKGADEVVEFFAEFKRRRPGPLTLVAVGDPVKEFDARDDFVITGYVDDQTKYDALAGATVLVHPSYFESFSMVLTEAWASGVPVMVQGRSEVLTGQVRRTGGGLAYTGYAEFEAALDRLLSDPAVRTGLGARGREYVEEHYSWSAVIDRYEAFLLRTSSSDKMSSL